MKIVHQTEEYRYRFKCNWCRNTFEAEGGEFKFVTLGLLEYDCPVCREPRRIEERLITRVPYTTYENC